MNIILLPTVKIFHYSQLQNSTWKIISTNATYTTGKNITMCNTIWVCNCLLCAVVPRKRGIFLFFTGKFEGTKSLYSKILKVVGKKPFSSSTSISFLFVSCVPLLGTLLLGSMCSLFPYFQVSSLHRVLCHGTIYILFWHCHAVYTITQHGICIGYDFILCCGTYWMTHI